ncbi:MULTISPECIES: chaperone modulator CbpM [Methylomonas]|uniref:chaperone modulator CbpM n=1 Tax=Methylomonas TaxID=416 RepID=UPI0012326885|nr:chaperone modulator CbpM [Methylomonas rhizoryzae]
MPEAKQVIDAILEAGGLTLQQLAQLSEVEPEWISRHIAEGLLSPGKEQAGEWRFSSASLLRIRRIVSLERDFEAVPELAALVADLEEEIAILRKRLQRAGLD